VGYLGVGKLIIIYLVLCLYDVKGGVVCIGGLDVCDVILELLYCIVGVVS